MYHVEDDNEDAVHALFHAMALWDEYTQRVPRWRKQLDKYLTRKAPNKRLATIDLHYDAVHATIVTRDGVDHLQVSPKNKRYELYKHAQHKRNRATIKRLNR